MLEEVSAHPPSHRLATDPDLRSSRGICGRIRAVKSAKQTETAQPRDAATQTAGCELVLHAQARVLATMNSSGTLHILHITTETIYSTVRNPDTLAKGSAYSHLTSGDLRTRRVSEE